MKFGVDNITHLGTSNDCKERVASRGAGDLKSVYSYKVHLMRCICISGASGGVFFGAVRPTRAFHSWYLGRLPIGPSATGSSFKFVLPEGSGRRDEKDSPNTASFPGPDEVQPLS